jgi:hypothetical protein
MLLNTGYQTITNVRARGEKSSYLLNWEVEARKSVKALRKKKHNVLEPKRNMDQSIGYVNNT